MMENFRELAEGADEVRVHLHQGDLDVRAAEGAEPSLTWNADGGEVPEVERSGNTLRIKQPDTFFDMKRMDVRLVLPAGARAYHLQTGHGDVELDGLRGQLRVNSGKGEVSYRDGDGEARLNTGHGAIKVRRFDGKLHAATGSGEIEAHGVEGDVDLSTGRGRIAVEILGSAKLRANSGMGEIQVKGGSVGEVRLNTGKGDLDCQATLAPGQHVFNTGFGDVTVQLPPEARARVDLQTGFGDVESDFPLVRVGRSGPMGFGGTRMVGSIGEGEAEIDVAIKTGKGDLRLRRTGGPAPGTQREHVSVGDRHSARHQRHFWRGLGADLATTISAEVATAISSSFGGPRVTTRVEPRPDDGAPAAPAAGPDAGGTPSSTRAAPPPPPLDMSGAVRSAQTPVGPEAPGSGGGDPMLAVLQAVARGEITPEEADRLLSAGKGGHPGGRG